mmetsp:Transcript_5269/g.12305  ORF Transcript_5269/g.12305 Transcript_5269/m.12305 type:complete len:294 (+) Transcript_5269:1844-2725(+)
MHQPFRAGVPCHGVCGARVARCVPPAQQGRWRRLQPAGHAHRGYADLRRDGAACAVRGHPPRPRRPQRARLPHALLGPPASDAQNHRLRTHCVRRERVDGEPARRRGGPAAVDGAGGDRAAAIHAAERRVRVRRDAVGDVDHGRVSVERALGCGGRPDGAAGAAARAPARVSGRRACRHVGLLGRESTRPARVSAPANRSAGCADGIGGQGLGGGRRVRHLPQRDQVDRPHPLRTPMPVRQCIVQGRYRREVPDMPERRGGCDADFRPVNGPAAVQTHPGSVSSVTSRHHHTT